MRYTISPEQSKFFYQNSYLQLEDLLSIQEAQALKQAIAKVKQNSPGYPDQNLYRSLPAVYTLAKKNSWGQIASELIRKKPLCIYSDRYFSDCPKWIEPLDEECVALLLDLEKCSGIFFHKELPQSDLYNSDQSCYFLLIMTTKQLLNALNPLLVR